MTGSIIMIILALMALIGIGSPAIKDFRLPSVVIAVLFGLIAGLNFIPTIYIGEFSFSVGTALLFLSAFLIWIFKGKIKNRLICLLVTVALGGALYGAIRLASFYGNGLWGKINPYYALIVGAIAFIATRNAKYGFISAVLSVGTATLLSQIGLVFALDEGFTPAVIAGATAIVLYCVVAKLMPSRPNKATYYFETGRMLD